MMTGRLSCVSFRVPEETGNARLKREQNGLKSLLCGLVGGAALLKEWEREWKEKFSAVRKGTKLRERTLILL
jgi:hypothetical protein